MTIFSVDDLLNAAGRVKSILCAMDDVINSSRERVEQDAILMDLIDAAEDSVQKIQLMGGYMKKGDSDPSEE